VYHAVVVLTTLLREGKASNERGLTADGPLTDAIAPIPAR